MRRRKVKMDLFGEAWLLDKMGNCIDVYDHPSESKGLDVKLEL